MFRSPATDFDYRRAPPCRRHGCQSVSVSIGQDIPDSSCLADASVLYKRPRYPPRSPLSAPAECYTVCRAAVLSSYEDLIYTYSVSPGRPPTMCSSAVLKYLAFITISRLACQKTGNDSDSLSSTNLRIEVGAFLIYQGVQSPS